MSEELKKRVIALSIAIGVAGPCEGLRQWAYRDITGLPTICMGSTKGVKMTDFRTIPECRALLTKEMMEFVVAVDTCQPGLPISVLAAFSSASYNLGTKIACDTTPWPKGSTAARMLKANDYRRACQQLPNWNKATVLGVKIEVPGLTRRRNIEMQTCLKDLT